MTATADDSNTGRTCTTKSMWGTPVAVNARRYEGRSNGFCREYSDDNNGVMPSHLVDSNNQSGIRKRRTGSSYHRRRGNVGSSGDPNNNGDDGKDGGGGSHDENDDYDGDELDEDTTHVGRRKDVASIVSNFLSSKSSFSSSSSPTCLFSASKITANSTDSIKATRGGNDDYYSTGYPSKSRHSHYHDSNGHSSPYVTRAGQEEQENDDNKKSRYYFTLRSVSGSSDGGDNGGGAAKLLPFISTSIISRLLKVSVSSLVVLYVLNQSHVLPKYAPKLSAWTSRVLFWPTLPITAGRRIGEWTTQIDDTVVLGGAPFGILNMPEKLQQQYNIRAVVNFCQEYRGPLQKYQRLGIEERYFPTVDHLEPSAEDLYDSLQFIQECQRDAKAVYVHCRAGHGRSGACALSWLMLQDMIEKQQHGPKEQDDQQQQKLDEDDDVSTLWRLNRELGRLRKVRSSLWRQPNIHKVRDAIKRHVSDYRNLPSRKTDPNLDSFFRTATSESGGGGGEEEEEGDQYNFVRYTDDDHHDDDR